MEETWKRLTTAPVEEAEAEAAAVGVVDSIGKRPAIEFILLTMISIFLRAKYALSIRFRPPEGRPRRRMGGFGGTGGGNAKIFFQ